MYYSQIKSKKVMQKTFKSSDERNYGLGPAYIISARKPDQLVGRVLTIIEALGLPEKQENSLKDILKQEIYKTLELDLWIPGALHTLSSELMEWHKTNGNMNLAIAVTPDSTGYEKLGYMPGKIELSYKEE